MLLHELLKQGNIFQMQYIFVSNLMSIVSTYLKKNKLEKIILLISNVAFNYMFQPIMIDRVWLPIFHLMFIFEKFR